MFPDKLYSKIEERKDQNAFRSLSNLHNLVDFSSNDYLGFAQSETIFNKTHQYLTDNNIKTNGATGSRLLTGNHSLYNTVESSISEIHQSEAALIFNSGYSANLGLLSCIPQRNDIVLYDEFSHASIRDGIKLSNAKTYSFLHNDLDDLKSKLERYKNSTVYVVTESVFSMDGDSPDLATMSIISNTYNAYLIIDEAHALGIFDLGLVQKLGLEKDVFARIMTFGKALGCHGAAILGNQKLKDYLINFSKPFIYTTGLSPHALATIYIAYQELINANNTAHDLHEKVLFFVSEAERLKLKSLFKESRSTIQSCIINGNENVKNIALKLHKKGFDVKPILSPTVTKGEERLRFCIHNYNTKEEITAVLEGVRNFVEH